MFPFLFLTLCLPCMPHALCQINGLYIINYSYIHVCIIYIPQYKNTTWFSLFNVAYVYYLWADHLILLNQLRDSSMGGGHFFLLCQLFPVANISLCSLRFHYLYPFHVTMPICVFLFQVLVRDLCCWDS